MSFRAGCAVHHKNHFVRLTYLVPKLTDTALHKNSVNSQSVLFMSVHALLCVLVGV